MSEETFDTLLAMNLKSVRNLVRMRIRRTDHADDIVQQTLLLAFSRRDQLRVESKFKSWLQSIAINEIRMFYRACRSSISLDELPGLLADPTPSPLAICEQRERTERLREGLATLSRRDRTALRLVDIEELTVAQAARVLTVKPAALRSTHFRARRRLARQLERAA